MFKWLNEQTTRNNASKYKVRLFKENSSLGKNQINELKSILEAAHRDAIEFHQALLFDDPLDPLKRPTKGKLPVDYPKGLDIQNLKGYFGEILTSNVAIHKNAFGITDWVVPAYRFRLHNTAFQKLLSSTQEGQKMKKIPGLTGDDCVLFKLNDQFELEKFIIGEAKCTKGHKASILHDAHEQVSATSSTPTVIFDLLTVIKSQSIPNKDEWVALLRNIVFSFNKHQSKRLNLVGYVCGKSPSSKNTWNSETTPNSHYNSTVELEVHEIHLSEVDELVARSYGK